MKRRTGSNGFRVLWVVAVVWVLPGLAGAADAVGPGTEASAPTPAWVAGARFGTASAEVWEHWTAEVAAAVADGANVILGWDRFQGTDWHTLFEPERSTALADTRQRAQWIHQTFPGVRYVIYMAPLEWTIEDIDSDLDGQVDPGKEGESLALQHPDWAQIGVDGRRAVFYGSFPGMPFWVCPSCEDVWVSPAHPGFRAAVLDLVQALVTETELDGIWHDVPFLMGGEFGAGWVGQFPDLGADARARFQTATGLSLPAPPSTPNWSAPVWQRYVAWRYELVADYLGELRDLVAGLDPEFALIPESSVDFDAPVTQLAASPVDLPGVSHATAHELGGTNRPVQYYRWLRFLAILQAWRHLDLAFERPSWLLSYVEAGQADTLEVARLHAAATESSGFRTLTSGDQGMTALVSAEFRSELHAWSAQAGGGLAGGGLRPLARVAVVYSRQTQDYLGRGDWEADYAAGFYGALMILLEGHVPFEVLPESALERSSDFDAVLLPGMEAMSDLQAQQLRDYVAAGGKLLAGGYVSRLDEFGNPRPELALADLFGTTLAEIAADESVIHDHPFGAGRAILAPEPHAAWYYFAADPDQPAAPADAADAVAQRGVYLDLLGRLEAPSPLETDAPSSLVLLPYLHPAGELRVGVVNLTGVSSATAAPRAQTFTLRLQAPFAPLPPVASRTEVFDPHEDLPAAMIGGGWVDTTVSISRGGLVAVAGCGLDLDADGKAGALTDGMLLLRYLWGRRGDALRGGAVDAVAGERTEATAIERLLDQCTASRALDVDGNGAVAAESDGLLVLRYLFGLRGAALADAIDPAGDRGQPGEVEAYLQELMP